MEMYHDGNRELQDRFDTRRLADRIEDVLVHETFTERDRAFVDSRDMFFLATADEDGKPNVSYKGGDPGFIRVIDDHTLAFPNYNGNGMYLSMGNLFKNPHVGLLFMDFEGRDRMRVNGEASVDFDDELRARWPEAQFVVRVQAREIFPNCPRYVHRYQKVQASAFVPRETVKPPCPRGSARAGPSMCCPKATPPWIRTRRSSDGDAGPTCSASSWTSPRSRT